MKKTILTVILMISLSSAAKAQFGWWASSDSTHIFNRNSGSVIISGYQALGKLTVGNDKDCYNLALVGDYSNVARNYLKIGVMPQSLDKYQGHTIFDLYHNNSEPRYAGFNFRINGTSRFFINGHGQIGIGTELPKALLDLNGGPDWNGFQKTIRLGESQALALETGGNEYGLVPTGGGISLVTSNGNSGAFGVPFSRLMSISKNKIVFDGDVEFRGNVTGSNVTNSGGSNGDTGGGNSGGSVGGNSGGIGSKYLLMGTPGGGAGSAWIYASNGNDIFFNGGNVGIGKAIPSFKLHIADKSQGGQSTPAAYIYGQSYGLRVGTQSAGTGYILSIVAGADSNGTTTVGSSALYVKYDGKIGMGTTTPGYKLDVAGIVNATQFYLNGQPFSGGSSQWTTSGSNIYYNTGNTAIGTTNQLTKRLIVSGNENNGVIGAGSASALEIRNEYTSTFNALSELQFSVGAGNNVIGTISGQYTNWNSTNNAGGDLLFSTKNSTSNSAPQERMRIRYDGTVGIGISNPDPNYKLSVNGKVKAQELYLTTTVWPDKVFEKNYVLMPLKELEKSIQKEKHLPNIPSEKEVIKNGVGVVEIQAKLLQKIEELTLYVIEQNKKIETLENQNQKIEALNKELIGLKKQLKFEN
jgi:hypothetical protein